MDKHFKNKTLLMQTLDFVGYYYSDNVIDNIRYFMITKGKTLEEVLLLYNRRLARELRRDIRRYYRLRITQHNADLRTKRKGREGC